MPFMDGYTCTQKIRTFLHDKGISDLKEQPLVVAVTGQVEPQYVARCYKCGMNMVLSKPVRVDSVISLAK